MGFVNTGNTNTLKLNFTDYGKRLIGGNAGTSLMTTLATAKFALRDHGMDYRRFSLAAVPGSTDTTTNGPCYDQQYSVSPYNERLSGTCFFNFPDVRGRANNEPCNKTVSEVNDISGGGPDESLAININVLYVNEEGIATIPNVAISPDPIVPDPPPVPACFDSGYDSTAFGLNENGCACTTYSNAWENILGASQNVGAMTGSEAQQLNWAQLDDYYGYAYYYPSYESVINVLVNSLLQNGYNFIGPNQTTTAYWSGYWGPLEGPGNSVEASQVTVTDTGGVVGDFNGDGIIGCDDLSWMINCYCQGLSEGDNVTGNAYGPLIQNNIWSTIDSYIVAAGCENEVPSALCDGSTPQCTNVQICGPSL